MITTAKITADVGTNLGTLTIRLRHTGACTPATLAALENATRGVVAELTEIIANEELGFEVHHVDAPEGYIVVSYAQDDAGMCDGSEDIALEVGIEAAANAGCVCPD